MVNLWIRTDTFAYFDFSVPYNYDGLCFLIPLPEDTTDYLALLRPMTLATWYAKYGMFCLKGLCAYLQYVLFMPGRGSLEAQGLSVSCWSRAWGSLAEPWLECQVAEVCCLWWVLSWRNPTPFTLSWCLCASCSGCSSWAALSSAMGTVAHWPPSSPYHCHLNSLIKSQVCCHF